METLPDGTPLSESQQDARTLAAWCSRSDAAYNIGAWQTALLLRPKEFRVAVAREIIAKGLDPEHPAVRQWGSEVRN
jgi:hypothetical protein